MLITTKLDALITQIPNCLDPVQSGESLLEALLQIGQNTFEEIRIEYKERESGAHSLHIQSYLIDV